MRLIDADKLQRHGSRGGVVHWQDIEDADCIDLVMCGDCKHASCWTGRKMKCKKFGQILDQKFFCAYGEEIDHE